MKQFNPLSLTRLARTTATQLIALQQEDGMEITVSCNSVETQKTSALVLLFAPPAAPEKIAAFNLSQPTSYLSKVTTLVQRGDFHGKARELRWLYLEDAPAQRLLVAGIGRDREDENFDGAFLQRVLANTVAACRKLGIKELCIPLAGPLLDQFGCANAARLVTEAVLLANYRFMQYKTPTDKNNSVLQTLTVLLEDSKHEAAVRSGAHIGEVLGTWTCRTRDLQNTPPNELSPARFAEVAQECARAAKLSCEVWDEHKIRENGMGALLGVAQGSLQPPRFVILENAARAANQSTLVLVGKGVTFDSGGLAIKPLESMLDMKYDMSGAAVVLSAMCALAQLESPLHLVGLLPLVENMPSGTAQRPGDVVRACNGKTIEVADTDAEGRLILAESLAYASRFQPEAVIDIATLTGAMFYVLGDAAAGLFANDAALASRIKSAAQHTGERVWELPLYPEFSQQLESEIADIRNVASKRGAGASKGAAFLASFVAGYKWAHLDIAAMASSTKQTALVPKGGTGWGVRLLVELCLNWKETKAS
ncbi:leucyl aminopeptidase [candidate division KSB1 bacterium]|nr:leucyl aminopeptidase [candidate division KSB1 bacterium]